MDNLNKFLFAIHYLDDSTRIFLKDNHPMMYFGTPYTVFLPLYSATYDNNSLNLNFSSNTSLQMFVWNLREFREFLFDYRHNNIQTINIIINPGHYNQSHIIIRDHIDYFYSSFDRKFFIEI